MRVLDQTHGEGWSLYHGDSIEVLPEVPAASVDLALYSPPFSSLFVYSPSERDVGNSKTDEEFFAHYSYVVEEVRRLLKPGRLCCVHSVDLPLTKVTHGVTGMRDFTGGLIEAHVEQGMIYHGRVTIDRCPQQLAIRNKSQSLLFVQLERDRQMSSPAFPDYILVFRNPGENRVPINDDSLTREEWISWARPVWPEVTDRGEQPFRSVWYDIRETNTLNVREARDNSDERHICPTGLDTLERCIRLWSNKGETILSPFAGLGSEGYMAVTLGRKSIGVELKESYYRTACRNMQEAAAAAATGTLFDLAEVGG